MKKIAWIPIFLCCVSSLFPVDSKTMPQTQPGAPPSPVKELDLPWLTGPLIVPNGTVTTAGHVYLQNYVNFNTTTGVYDSNWNSHAANHNYFSFNPQIIAYVGLTEWMDVFIAPQGYCNHYHEDTDGRFGDLPVGLDFQPIAMDTKNWYPGVKLTIKETFPTGQYQNLNPSKMGTDIGGAGTYGTTFNVLLHNVYHLWNQHYLSLFGSWGYTINTNANVKGFNAYGGGYGTSGKVNTGNSWQGIFSFEFTFNRQWAIAMDTVYTHVDRSSFTGNTGTYADGTTAIVGLPSSEQLAFCPALEYNFNEHIGLIVGCYMTATGRNSAIFRNGIAEVTVSY